MTQRFPLSIMSLVPSPLARGVLQRHGVANADAGPATHAPDAAFLSWFQASQVTDAEGRPLVVFHGTGADVRAFTVEQDGAHYFSTSAETAAWFAENADKGWEEEWNPNVLPVHLAIQKPKRFTLAALQALIGVDDDPTGVDWTAMPSVIAQAKAEGYDGMHLVGVMEYNGERADQWLAFDATQIKSVYNTGSYDAANPDIRFARTHTVLLPTGRSTFVPAALPQELGFGASSRGAMDHATLTARLGSCADANDVEALADEYAKAYGRYLHGECHLLALALHARTKAPLWAAIETRGERAGCLIHAFVDTGAGVIDLRGLRSRAAMLREFEVWAPEFQPIEPEALAQLGSAMSLVELAPDIEAARDMAAAVARIVDRQQHFAAQANFEAWHIGSKAITAEGRPLVAYHGTASDFTAFDPVAEGIDGIYFSSSPAIAGEYANWRGTPAGGATIYPVHLAIRNPLEVTDLRAFDAHEFQMRIYDAQEGGHDGVVFRDVRDGWDSQICADTWVAFHPTQIKSVFNTGSYAPGDPDIRFARDRTRPLPADDKPPVLPARKVECDPYEP